MKKLNFGCGNDIKEDFDNVDIQKGKRIKKSFDFDKFPYPLKKNTYDYVLIDNVLEHLDNPLRVLLELRKICKPGALIEVIVPHYTHKGAYSDMGHKHFFNDNSFRNLEKLPTEIDKTPKFKIEELRLKPTILGRIFPGVIRKKLSQYINGLIGEIRVKIKVIKN